jgi:hypothetical protein
MHTIAALVTTASINIEGQGDQICRRRECFSRTKCPC